MPEEESLDDVSRGRFMMKSGTFEAEEAVVDSLSKKLSVVSVTCVRR